MLLRRRLYLIGDNCWMLHAHDPYVCFYVHLTLRYLRRPASNVHSCRPAEPRQLASGVGTTVTQTLDVMKSKRHQPPKSGVS